MKVAFYYGDHKKDGPRARFGYFLTRLGQSKEEFGHFTHCEAVFSGDYTKALIGSASVRDGMQIRIKETALVPGRWVVWDVPALDEVQSQLWFEENTGTPYSMIGAASSAVWIIRMSLYLVGKDPKDLGQWCSRSIPESVGLRGSSDLSVSELATLLWNMKGTTDITDMFFDEQVEVVDSYA